MTTLRALMVLMFVVLGAYTVIVGMNHGWNLIPIFFGDIMEMAWPGQFNLDFMGFLILSALWVSWRHHFTPGGLGLGLLALFGGIMFLSVYLFIVAGQAKGDVKELFLGKSRAGA